MAKITAPELMKEADACSRWCPHTTVSLTYGVSYGVVQRTNRGEATDGCKCVGSACMGWRWGREDSGKAMKLGYCGLVGKPEAANE